jgi:hypothetical protein
MRESRILHPFFGVAPILINVEKREFGRRVQTALPSGEPAAGKSSAAPKFVISTAGISSSNIMRRKIRR